MKDGGSWDGPPQPEILPGFASWYGDFFELSTDRQIGMAAGPLPAASIDRHTNGWDDDDADMFRACMRAMDLAFMDRTKKPPSGPEQTPEERLKAIFGDALPEVG